MLPQAVAKFSAFHWFLEDETIATSYGTTFVSDNADTRKLTVDEFCRRVVDGGWFSQTSAPASIIDHLRTSPHHRAATEASVAISFDKIFAEPETTDHKLPPPKCISATFSVDLNLFKIHDAIRARFLYHFLDARRMLLHAKLLREDYARPDHHLPSKVDQHASLQEATRMEARALPFHTRSLWNEYIKESEPLLRKYYEVATEEVKGYLRIQSPSVWTTSASSVTPTHLVELRIQIILQFLQIASRYITIQRIRLRLLLPQNPPDGSDVISPNEGLSLRNHPLLTSVFGSHLPQWLELEYERNPSGSVSGSGLQPGPINKQKDRLLNSTANAAPKEEKHNQPPSHVTTPTPTPPPAPANASGGAQASNVPTTSLLNSYENLGNFIKRIDAYEGKQRIKPPKLLYSHLIEYFEKHPIPGVSSLQEIRDAPLNARNQKDGTSIAILIQALQATRNTIHYRDMEYIAHVLWGWKLADVTSTGLRRILIADYIHSQKYYDELKEPYRISSLNVNVRLFFHLSARGYPCYAEDFKMVSSIKSIAYHIRMLKYVSEQTGLPFTPFVVPSS